MDYRVIKFFIDRDTLKAFSVGDKYPCADLERAAQLIHRGYIKREEASQVEEDPKDEPKDKPEPKKKTTTAKAKTAAKKAVTKKKA